MLFIDRRNSSFPRLFSNAPFRNEILTRRIITISNRDWNSVENACESLKIDRSSFRSSRSRNRRILCIKGWMNACIRSFFFFHSVPFSGDEQRINKFGQKRRYAYASIVSQLECFISVESCGYLFLFKISDIICLKSNFFSENNLFQSYSMDRVVNFSPFVFFIRSRYLVITRTFKTIRLQLWCFPKRARQRSYTHTQSRLASSTNRYRQSATVSI